MNPWAKWACVRVGKVYFVRWLQRFSPRCLTPLPSRWAHIEVGATRLLTRKQVAESHLHIPFKGTPPMNFFTLVPPSQKAKQGATPVAHRPLKNTRIFEGHSLSTLKHTLCWCLNYVMCLSIKKVSKRSPLNLWFRIPALFTLNDEKKCQFINREKPARDCILKHKFVHISFLRKLPSGLSAH